MLLRKRHKDLQGLGVQAVAVSVDHLPAQKVFHAAMAEFPFPLAADWLKQMSRDYDVLEPKNLTARRVFYLIDGAAVVRHAVVDFDPAHPETLDALVNTARML